MVFVQSYYDITYDITGNEVSQTKQERGDSGKEPKLHRRQNERLNNSQFKCFGKYGKEKFWKEGLKRENFIHLHNTELFNKIINVFVS